ncbi:MAG: zinc ribbon domain-containing protein [Planctomycetota bacterium]|jgi:predicted  nucleic acid-binding Zn-ribbon protein
MHETMAALLALHDIDRQRQVLLRERSSRGQRLIAAENALAAANAARDEAEAAAHNNDALIRQYEADLERCEATIVKLRDQQGQAASNREYLACINGTEKAKAEITLRTQSLTTLRAETDARTAAAEQASAAATAAEQALADLRAELASANTDVDCSEEELERLYQERRGAVDGKVLAAYERLVTTRHPMPLMKVNASTRATPLGNIISTQQLERLRLGQLVIDPSSNAILYVDDE